MSEQPASKILWSGRRYVIATLLTATLLVGGGGYWAVSATLAGAVIASGELRVEGERKTVQHLDGGVVKEILVEEGQAVAAGALLMRLDPTSLAAELGVVEARLDEALAAGARLEAERRGTETMALGPLAEAHFKARGAAARRSLEGHQALFEARRRTQGQRRERIDQQIQQTRRLIEGRTGQIGALERQRTIAADELASAQKLYARRLTPKSAVARLEREIAEIEGDLNALTAQTAEAEARIAELEVQILEQEADRREQILQEQRDAAARAAELLERRTALRAALDRVEIRAPIAGAVLDLSVNTVGGVVSPAAPLMYLVPTDSGLVAAARIDPARRDQVMIGQPAQVLFPGFNQRTTPQLTGRVAKIGADALSDPNTGAAYFPIEVAIPDPELARLRAAISTELSPGMPVEVHVLTSERSAASYLLKPLTDSFRRALKEE